MPRNGSGTYSLPAGNPVVTGTTISSTVHNATLADIVTALTNSLAKDGQTTPTANIPLGNFRITGLGAATAVADAAQTAQVQNSALKLLGTVAGTNTITAVLAPVPAAYASGQLFTLVPANTNTGATTLNISSLGAKNIFMNGAACAGGELIANVPVLVEYDGTQFNIIGSKPHAKVVVFTRDSALASGNQTISGVGFKPSAVVLTVGLSTNDLASWGTDDVTTAACIYKTVSSTFTAAAAGSSMVYSPGGGALYNGSFSSFNSDGGVIAWTRTGVPTGTFTVIATFIP